MTTCIGANLFHRQVFFATSSYESPLIEPLSMQSWMQNPSRDSLVNQLVFSQFPSQVFISIGQVSPPLLLSIFTCAKIRKSAEAFAPTNKISRGVG